MLPDCIIIGHRGAAGLVPENTLLSYQSAFEFGADMIELDAHETSDGHIVCIHDYEVDRTTDGSGYIAEMSLKEIQDLDAGQGQKIPLLSEVLDFAYGKIKVKVLDIEKRIATLVKEKRMMNNVIVSSFLHGTLQVMHEIDANIKTAVLFKKPLSNPIEYASELGAIALNPLYTIVSSELIKQAHDNEIRIFPWTINDSDTMIHFKKQGVDGIITDFPNIAIEALGYNDSTTSL